MSGWTSSALEERQDGFSGRLAHRQFGEGLDGRLPRRILALGELQFNDREDPCLGLRMLARLVKEPRSCAIQRQPPVLLGYHMFEPIDRRQGFERLDRVSFRGQPIDHPKRTCTEKADRSSRQQQIEGIIGIDELRAPP